MGPRPGLGADFFSIALGFEDLSRRVLCLLRPHCLLLLACLVLRCSKWHCALFPSSSALACGICRIHASSSASVGSYEIGRTGLWVLRHHPDPSPLLGWLFLDSSRHLGGPIDFNLDEASAWGAAVQQASQLVRQLTACDRVYAIAFGEGARHLHLHLIPRFEDHPTTSAWSIADHYRSVERGECVGADPGAVAILVERARSLAHDLWGDDLRSFA